MVCPPPLLIAMHRPVHCAFDSLVFRFMLAASRRRPYEGCLSPGEITVPDRGCKTFHLGLEVDAPSVRMLTLIG